MTFHKQCVSFIVLAAALSFYLPATHAAPPAINSEIRALATTAGQAGHRTPHTFDARDWLERFYGARDYAPAWLNDGTANADAAVTTLQDAAAHGLSPADYNADALAQQLRAASTSDAARLDVELSVAMLHYLADLHFGRVVSEYHTPLPDRRAAAFDPVEQLRSALASNRVQAALEAAEPRIPLYARVKHTLAHYRQLAGEPHEALPLPPKAAKAGRPYAGTKALHARLIALGDLGADAAPVQDERYTHTLVEAVKHFQLRHGLEADGVLGRATIAALNVPLSRRVRQLELTLERLRWLPDFAPGRIIAVNLAAYRLWAFDTASATPEPPLEMRVIVGAAVNTPTPLFIGQLRYLEFNPYWNVPRSIQRDEIIPKLEKNPEYLAENEMELVPLGGTGVPTSTLDAETMSALREGKYRVRQRPGPKNALGAVKFAMPNPMDIYLHSTSARELFNRSRRDLSHGCIRVEKAEELAQFVLSDQPQWSAESIAAAMGSGPTRTVSLKERIPVVLFYATATTDRENRALFSEDVYRRDEVLEQALKSHSSGGPVASAAR